MKLHYLKYFCVVAEELHFHRAADRLHISQPPLTAAIKSLEEELGIQLLRRNSKMVELTSAGSAFLNEAREILERVSRASTLVRAFENGVTGRLDIGFSGSLLYREIPKILSRFQSETRTISVVLHEHATVEQIDKVMRRQLDAGFVHGENVPPQVKSLPLKVDHFVLCLPDRHPMAGKPSVNLRDFDKEQFVMFSREAAPSNHDRVIAQFTAAGIHPRTIHSARNWMTIIAMVSQLAGVALVPKSLARSSVQGVRFLPFHGSSAAAPAMLIWNPSSESRELASFVECATRVVKGSTALLPGKDPPRRSRQTPERATH